MTRYIRTKIGRIYDLCDKYQRYEIKGKEIIGNGWWESQKICKTAKTIKPLIMVGDIVEIKHTLRTVTSDNISWIKKDIISRLFTQAPKCYYMEVWNDTEGTICK